MKHILLIDDNEVDNFINKKIVTKANIAELITVIDFGPDAIEFLANLIFIGKPFPEAIFLDIQMPVMDGFQFLDEYAKFPDKMTANCCVNMLTSSNNANDLKRASECKYVKNFFNKPINIAMFEKL